MKLITQTREPGTQGNVLIVALAVAFILGITLSSFLILTQRQNFTVARSQTWNTAVAVAEAGVEDALAFVNKYNTDMLLLPTWTNSSSLAEDYWYQYYANSYYTVRFLNGDLANGVYVVIITNAPAGPIITSWGYSRFDFAAVTGSGPLLAQSGTGSDEYQTQYLRRRLRVATTKDPMFAVAMAADEQIDLNGNDIATDSFDSLYTPGGLYDASQRKDNGDVVTNFDIVNALDVGNADIMGHVKTGPGGTVDVGPNGSVGSKDWVMGGNTGIEPGYADDDMNVRFHDVTLPTTTWLPLGSGDYTIDEREYKHVILSSGDYYISGLGGSLYVATNVQARLHVTSSVALTGDKDEIRLSPQNSRLIVYMSGANFKVKGNGVVNETGKAENFLYFGLPSNTAVDFGGEGAFTGAIYAPQAAFSMGGGGNDVIDFVGASVSKSVKMNGHFNFHYDENLRRVGPGRGYIPISWAEI